MAFVVDVVSEDSFYDNLTLGLIRMLSSTPGVQDLQLEKRLPCERAQLTSWEQRHCCTLPEDMRQFYTSTDGFKMTWSYEYAGEMLPIGNLHINGIADVRRLASLRCGDDCTALPDIETGLGPRCKIFELDACQAGGKVCLVYQDTTVDPKVYLLDRCFQWHQLASSFTQYFRMMLVHQGLPQWQLRFTPMGLTPWAEQLFALIAPHLLQPEHVTPPVDWADTPYNHLDPSIFKMKNSKKKSESTKASS